MIALLAFAGNSILCRLALAEQTIDATSFTLIRLFSGALVLTILLALTKPSDERGSQSDDSHGSWGAAFALFLYAAAFSFAYLELDTGMGALILFSSVQITMIVTGLFKGNHLGMLEWTGFTIAMAGFIYLVAPGANSPSILGSLLMMVSGIAWGMYSIIGASSTDALTDTGANFRRGAILSLTILPILLFNTAYSIEGAVYAVISGAITSGVGYAIWYKVLPSLRPQVAAVSQLSVPVIATIGGWILLNETLTLPFAMASGIILSGIGLVIFARNTR